MDATQIQKEAEQFVLTNPNISFEINSLANSRDALFEYFIKQVKQNNYLIVSYILNFFFVTAEERAAFGNRQDSESNTAYHYAAMYDCMEVLIVLNDKRPFKGKKKFFRFNLVNRNEETPLSVCCKKGNIKVFDVIWPRVGKANHNPTHCFFDACIGGNVLIIEKVIVHPKFNIKVTKIAQAIIDGLAGKFGDSTRNILKSHFIIINGVVNKLNNLSDGLKKRALFRDNSVKAESNHKKLKADKGPGVNLN
jgi:hypothetical protein